MSCNGWKHLKNYRLSNDFCARNIEMRDASRKKTGSSQESSFSQYPLKKGHFIIEIPKKSGATTPCGYVTPSKTVTRFQFCQHCRP